MPNPRTSSAARQQEGAAGGADSKYDVQHVGERLRAVRLAKGLTVNGLAAIAQVPPSTISKMENGRLKPSLVHAINLATALGENLGFLVDRYRSDPEDVVVLHGRSRSTIEYPEMGLALEDLNGNFHSGVLESRLGTLQKGATSGVEPMTHPGEEFCHVLKGALRYVIDGEVLDLGVGDSIHFKCDLEHRWENRHSGVTSVLWVFSDGLSF